MPPRAKTAHAGNVWGRGAKQPGRALWERVRDSTARALSHNREDERALLGGLLLYQGGPDLYRDTAGRLSPADFAVPQHQWLFRLLGELVAEGKPTDLLAVGDELERRSGEVDAPELRDVANMPDACPSVVNVPTIAERVLEHARRRRLQEGLIGAIELVTDGNRPASEAAEYAAARIASVVKNRNPSAELSRWHVGAVLARMLDRPAPVAVAPLPGCPIKKVTSEGRHADELESKTLAASWPALAGLLGGWWADTLAVLVGHTGRGKSSLAIQIAEQAARHGAPVLYASMEMGTDELVARLLALRGRDGASWSALKRGAYTSSAVAKAGARLVEDAPHLYLWAPGAEGRNPEALQRMARSVSAAAGGCPPLVVLDYVQRLATPASGSATDDRRGAVSDLSGRLRDLSRPGGLGDDWPGAAVLALSSTGRNNYAAFGSTEELRKATELEGSGKESGELEYDAPVLLCMTSNKPSDGEIEPPNGRLSLVRVVKNREGSGGSSWMLFEAARGRFVETQEPKDLATSATSNTSRPKRGPSLAD